jgi:hypothetical protein
MGISDGFRPGRGCHHALDAVYMAITTRKAGFWMQIFNHSLIKSIMIDSLNKSQTAGDSHHFFRKGFVLHSGFGRGRFLS